MLMRKYFHCEEIDSAICHKLPIGHGVERRKYVNTFWELYLKIHSFTMLRLKVQKIFH